MKTITIETEQEAEYTFSENEPYSVDITVPDVDEVRTEIYWPVWKEGKVVLHCANLSELVRAGEKEGITFIAP